MRSPHPVLKPSGEIEADGITYRLEQQDGSDQFDVLRTTDGTRVGRFRLIDGSSVEPVDADAGDVALIRAIGALLAQPRGLLPLQ